MIHRILHQPSKFYIPIKLNYRQPKHHCFQSYNLHSKTYVRTHNHTHSLIASPRFSFCTSTQDPLANLTFQQLLQLKSTESLTKAAQIMAHLQIQHENLDSQLIRLHQQFSQFPQQNQALMERIRSILDNLKMQQKENTQIQKRAQKQLFVYLLIENCKTPKNMLFRKQPNKSLKSVTIFKGRQSIHKVTDQSMNVEICQSTHSQVKMFHKELQQVFKKFGIEEFDPVGKEYDPNTQESMVKLPLPANMAQQEKVKRSNTVVQCFRTGYKIKGRLLRSAHVVVYE